MQSLSYFIVAMKTEYRQGKLRNNKLFCIGRLTLFLCAAERLIRKS